MVIILGDKYLLQVYAVGDVSPTGVAPILSLEADYLLRLQELIYLIFCAGRA
jgi:hypothetical protein